MRRAARAAVILAVLAAAPAAAQERAPGSSGGPPAALVAAATNPDALVRPERNDVRPKGRLLTADHVAAVADRVAKVRRELRDVPGRDARGLPQGR